MTKENVTLQTRFVVTFTVCRAAHSVMFLFTLMPEKMQYFLFFLFRTSQYCHKNSTGLQLDVILALGKRLIIC